ncbi:MAG: orotate phosphoribosyltransferase-like protein [Candidatus Methanoperedenaceae archaeon]|nr:orotate phosphoribosyltransferase-like protein [Candidatus Methanoperedenaceae archaeon]MDW7725786.1 orotate phosphoribosyltransferase-like protein [Candidatus Methanoperedens sp.]
MKTIDELTKKAVELQSSGLLPGQIADELNVSSETATWLLLHSRKEEKGELSHVPKDIYVDWSTVGKSSYRQRLISSALTDLVLESLQNTGKHVDVVIGVALSGIPLASLMGEELECEFSTYHPNKHKWEPESKKTKGTISQNFARVEGKNCVIVDDVVTSGSTLREAVTVLEELGAKTVSIAVMIDKKGIDDISGVPLNALLRVTRVDRSE